MRISVNWLRELVDVNLSPEELGETLTIAGLEVEDMEDRRKMAQGVVVGKILKREAHPDASKLSICQVDIGEEKPAIIVCGAPNAQADVFVPVATLGAYLPAVNLKIKPAKLRGVASSGMICSLAELGLEKESDGIYIFPEENLTIGAQVAPLLGLDDVILDITPTANRADAMSMVGVAREIAALTGAALKLPKPAQISIPKPRKALKLNISENQACPAYIGTVIAGVKIAPSPEWLRTRLESAGVRPINNVVDITNYILLEWGQPLHAFDREKLLKVANSKELTIGVRFATDGETLLTLDEQNRPLKSQNLLITANDVPVAIGGVIGGKSTEVSENTQNIVLEAALFDPVTVRRSARAQSIRTESSARYERGVNQIELELACQRAIALIIELAGGTVIEQVIADHRPDHFNRNIQLRLERVNQVLGPVQMEIEPGQIAAEDVERILTDLGCKLETVRDNPQVWAVTVPSYRYRDLEREIDLIEEVARLYGYDRFCDTLPGKTEPGGLSLEQQLQRKVREGFRAAGLTEVVQYSLVKPVGDEVILANPLFAEYSALRTNLLDGLITAFEYNQAQGNGALNAFEIGRIFWRNGDDVEEADQIAGILGGDITPQGRWTRSGKAAIMTWYEAKGILENVFQYLGIAVEYRPETTDSRLHPGRTASLWLRGKHLGIFGQIHPQLRQAKGLIDAVYGFELNWEVLLLALQQDKLITPRYQAYSSYPAVERDLAFFAPISLSFAELEKVMLKAGKPLLAEVELFDDYQGQNVPANQRSLAFSLAYRASDRTLTDQEVEPIHNQVREALVKKFSVTLRS
jgi:phenylalanyl-tRNA synthetase beta chain